MKNSQNKTENQRRSRDLKYTTHTHSTGTESKRDWEKKAAWPENVFWIIHFEAKNTNSCIEKWMLSEIPLRKYGAVLNAKKQLKLTFPTAYDKKINRCFFTFLLAYEFFPRQKKKHFFQFSIELICYASHEKNPLATRQKQKCDDICVCEKAIKISTAFSLGIFANSELEIHDIKYVELKSWQP